MLPLAIASCLAQRADVARLVRCPGERIRRWRVLREPPQGTEPRQYVSDGQAYINEFARRYPEQRGESAWVETHAFGASAMDRAIQPADQRRPETARARRTMPSVIARSLRFEYPKMKPPRGAGDSR